MGGPLIGRVRDRLVLDRGESVERGLDLGFLLVLAPRRREAVRGNLRGDLEALVVVRALLVQDQVAGGTAEFALGDLLQLGLRVAAEAVLRDLLDLGFDEAEDERLGRVPTAVEEDGRDEGLEHVREHVPRHFVEALHSLAEEQVIAEAEFRAELRTNFAAHDYGLDLRQVAFLELGEAAVKLFASDEAEHAVAEELHAFVGAEAGVRARGVREGRAEEFRLAESIADCRLAIFEDGLFVPDRSVRRRRHGRSSGISRGEGG